MKRAACGVLLVVAVLLLAPVASQAGGHGWRGHGRHGHGWHGQHWRGHRWYGHRSPRFHIGIGSAFWWGSGPGWYGPPRAYVYPAPVYVPPPRVIVAEQPVYVQREPAAALPPSYWYYCESAGAYYPSVPTCREPWVQVPPRTE